MTEEAKTIIREQAHEILDIVLDANGFESRHRGETGTLPTLFFSYSGHINRIEAQLYKDGWCSGDRYDREWSWRLDSPINQERIDEMKKEISDALECKDETETLARDIEKLEESINGEKEKLKKMKARLRKKRKGSQ